ncbi:hypothetical protein COV16_04045 [Candidatus Woesearchaeota archaeon CG10_big_fil_rev_8_21_14_0_10_34_8]|nr:MAG: hypothetical protein COV16_04045 [Candidatus Woesearchaeota archaeon CG10_big_fil_rev_8_21_14_0_10_34_8]
MVEIKDLNTRTQPNWCPGCVPPGTKIHSNPSLVNVETLRVGDKVLGYDGKYHKITEVFNRPYKGKMYSISTTCFGETLVTHEHPLLIARRDKKGIHNKEFKSYWVEAENVREGDYMVYPNLRVTEDLDKVKLNYKIFKKDTRSKELPREIQADANLLRLFGYYIAEGCINKRSICFYFHKDEEKYIDDVIKLVKDIFNLDSTLSTTDEKNLSEISVHSAKLARVFSDWFGKGALNKKIPHFAMLLPYDKQKGLLQGLWRGDGWFDSKDYKRANYKTISPILSEQIKFLLLRQGIVPSITINKAYGIHKQSYSIQVLDDFDLKKLASILEINIPYKKYHGVRNIVNCGDFIYLPIRKIKTLDYDGFVHNFEVEDVNSYVSPSATLHNCGDFGILLALKMAVSQLGLNPKDVCITSGIGCGSKLPHWINTYGFHSIHGRGLPVATGIHLVNNKLKIISVGGDGDGYGIGLSHFIHSCRRNLDMAYFVQNNQIYGLTKGQASPTTDKETKTISTPFGVIEWPIFPLALAIESGATFVARGFAGDVKHLTELMKQAIEHPGFAYIDIMQPCVTFNKKNTYDWFKQRVYKLEESGHDFSDRDEAMKKANEWNAYADDNIPIGLFYKKDHEHYMDRYEYVKDKPLVDHDISKVDITKIMEDFV